MAAHFKCNSCQIQFMESDAQRYHMKTDWHRYNLKRRVAGLTPVDAAIFAEKLDQSKQYEQEVDEFGFQVLPEVIRSSNRRRQVQHRGLHIQQSRDREDRGKGHLRDSSPASTVDSRTSHFSLGESVYSHADTHSEFDSTFETGSEAETQSNLDDDSPHFIDSDVEHLDDQSEQVALETSIQPITSCIFCGVPHEDVETNVNHMFRSHGLYIPERTYLTDLKGLLEYLISVIVLDNECFCCSFKGKNLESIRAHTTSKGHCRLPFETKEERSFLAQFYDFSSINSEVKASKSQKKVEFVSGDDQNHDLSAEEDYENSSDDDRSENGINDNYTIAMVDPSDSQLSLPNGQRLGHRSLQRWTRHNMRVSLPLTPLQGQMTVTTADRRLVGGLTLQEYEKQEKAIRLTESKLKNRNVVRDVRRSNYQPHFRDPMLQ